VERLPAGTFLLMDREHEHQGRFWTMRFDGARSPRSEEDWAADLEHKLRAAVASHLAADVPVGAFLSGGWDSSLITVFAAEASARRLKTFSLAFPEAPHENEARYSRLVAERAGSEHHEVEFRTTQAPALLAKAVEALEEPCATAPAILFFHLSAAASREVKTVIGGEGSDELFAGYRWLLSNWPYALRRVTPRAALSPLAGLVRDGRWGRLLRLATADSELQAHLEWHHRFAGETPSELLHPDLPIQPNPDTCLFSPPAETWESCRDRLEQRLSLEFTGRLADGILLVDDKASMAHSLEVRLPFLDRAVVDFALSLPSGLKVKDGREKHILSHLARRHLPPEVARRRKYGLHFPMKGKPNAAFAAFLRETLLSARNPEIFQRTPLERWLGEALAGRLGGQSRAWGLAVFASWWDRFVG